MFSVIGLLAPIGAMVAGPNPVLIGAALVIGGLMLGNMPLLLSTVPQESVRPADGATATGLVMGIGQLLGGTLGPIIAGILSATYGPLSAMYFATGLAAFAAIGALFVRKPDAGIHS